MKIAVRYVPVGYRLWHNSGWWTMDLCKNCGADAMLNVFCISCYTAREDIA